MHHQAQTRIHRISFFLPIITGDHVFSTLLIVMKVHDVFVPVKQENMRRFQSFEVFSLSCFSAKVSLKCVILTVVLVRTLFDGSNESDNLGDVTLSIGVLG